ncbi:AAA family ATPase [Vannielia litorea]|uniref:Pilus assembly protein CpaE n=1 Tax=Vannielia litorea TaxID=1217970 RepID=A0A1N6EAL0_9RHOB|nr:AAA family ATPase [Vannielia litorea]SIN80059.1 pilus assembly protein CpaE [Vannielia litorea]
MTMTAVLQPEPAPITACTVSRDVQNFDLLIEDMETELGESWGDLGFADASAFLDQDEAEELKFFAVALDSQDEANLPEITALITKARDKGVKVILIAEDVSPIVLHQLLHNGADDFVPYPLPENALHDAIERLNKPAPAPVQLAPQAATPTLTATGDRDGVVLAVHGMAGGTGATTFAVNLAYELATQEKKDNPRVCLIDLDFQFGSTATFLDLDRKEAVYEILSDTASMDSSAFMAALQSYNDKIHVLTAPAEMLPLDIATPDDISAVLEVARANFDFVVIDMPTTVCAWTETVLDAAQVYFAPIELDMRSAQNVMRMIRALKSEDLPYEKLRFALNRSPKFTDLSGKARVKRMAEGLDIDIELMLANGAKQVSDSADHGQPLAEFAPKNPLRRDIQKLAQSLLELVKSAEEAA